MSPLPASALLRISHAITRGTVELFAFETGEDVDYRVTLGASMRLVHRWVRLWGHHQVSAGIELEYIGRRGDSEVIVLRVGARGGVSL